jgi:c-di-GMP phosphodiesterase
MTVGKQSAVITPSIIFDWPMFRYLASLFQSKHRKRHADRKPLPADPKAAADAAASAKAFARLNEVAPLATVQDEAKRPFVRTVPSFVRREAVLNRDERIAGYEFSLDRPMQERFKNREASIRKMYDILLMRQLAEFGVGSLLGHRLAVIEIAAASTSAGIPDDLPRANTIIFLNTIEDAGLDPAITMERIDALVSAGFQVGWSLRQAADVSNAALARCQFVRIETPGFDGIQLRELAKKLGRINRSGGKVPLQIIARDVKTYDDFQVCFHGGFHFFQGPFISSRKSWKNPKSDVDRLHVFSLLKQLRSGADHAVLAAQFRNEPMLTFRLLRYVNSASLGLQRRIGAIDQALYLIGADKLYRWLSLLLYDIKDRGFAERAMIEQVLVRARTMESLSKAPVNPDLAFLTGLLSMLDQFVGRPIEEVMPQINVPDDVRAALLSQTGPYAPLLDLAKVCEQGDPTRIAAAAARCGVDQGILNSTVIAALNWAYETAETAS